MPSTSGYSKTPLSKKLGFKSNFSVYLINPPDGYWKLFDVLPEGIREVESPEEGSLDFIHFFCTSMAGLKEHAIKCKNLLKKDGMLWVSWPKGNSKIPTDLKREPIRDHVLKIGLVDIKVCAVNEDWSGLKFVYHTADR